jgi:hypothetical protein
MSVPENTGLAALSEVLSRLTAGSIGASVDGAEIARVDADARTVTVEMDPLVPSRAADGRSIPGFRVPLWSARGFPGALARCGWRVDIRSQGRDVVTMGRGVSPLTGHVRLYLRGLGQLRRLL